MKNVAIVIPYHSNNLSSTEKISLKRMMKVFSTRDVFILTTNSLDIDICNITTTTKIIRIDDKWLVSREAYNSLLLSTYFYELFSDYKYILISQLDVLVFEDKLDFFISLEYDYYGAPWVYGYTDYLNLKRKVLYVGNGGYSLRKVDSTIKVIDSFVDMPTTINEDIFFSSIDDTEYKKAPFDVALKFAFERDVKECYKRNGNMLPSACHAWNKYDFAFVKSFLDAEDVDTIEAEDYRNDDEKNQDNYRYYKKLSKLLEDENLFASLKSRISSLFGTLTDECVLWGNGPKGKNVFHILNDSNILVKKIIDSNENKQGNYYENTLVTSPNQISKNTKVIVATDSKWYFEIEQVLNNMGMNKGVDYFFWNEFIDSIKL